MVEDERNDGRIVVAVDDEAEARKSKTQVARVKYYALEALEALPGAMVPVMMRREERICIRTGGAGLSP